MNILTLENLYDALVSRNESFSFSSNGDDDTIRVRVPEVITFDENDYDPESGLLKTHLKSCHLYKNRNRSSIPEDSMVQAIPSFYNRPILGYIHQLADGSYDFAGHEMIINKDGETEYQEIAVGVIPESCNAQLVYDKEKDKTYLEVDGYIFEDYTRAAQILRSKGTCKVSVEIAVEEMSFSAKEKVLVINKFHFCGVTILGCTADENERPIEEGMEGSNIKIQNSLDEPKTLADQLNDPKIIEMLDKFFERMKNEFANLTINNNTNGKEENILVENNELTFDQGVTTEAETTTTEGEVTATVEPTTEDTPSNVGENEINENETEIFTEGTGESTEGTAIDTSETENENEVVADGEAVTDPEPEDNTTEVPVVEMTREEAFQKFFELSHDDIYYALNALLAVYRNNDEWCYVRTVYDGYFIMQDWDSDKFYKQEYTKDGDTVALSGERVQMFQMMLTESEKLAIEEMRSNYSLIQERLAGYKLAELNAARKAVLDAEEYSVLAENEEFTALRDNMENYTPEELSREADLIFAKHAKKNTFSFAAGTNKTKTIAFGATSKTDNEVRKPYGGLIEKFKKQQTNK